MPKNRKLNICLHNIVKNISQVNTIYDITSDQLVNLNKDIKSQLGRIYDSYNLYFDDGYGSFLEIVTKLNLGLSKSNVHIAVIVDKVGADGRLSADNLIYLDREGFTISSHGVSHAALAIFDNDIILQTELGGKYINTECGKNKCLTENEILYQLNESKIYLESLLHKSIDEFVLPYGLYNKAVLDIIIKKTTYKNVLSCDMGIDEGQFLAPRLLITQDNINNIGSLLKGLKNN